jgi:CubicO group peptidase (beta-lactamase class C family)
MDPDLLRRAESIYSALFPSAYSLLVIRDGRIVLESYLNGASSDYSAHIFSITKTVMSALTGIAIQEGLIDGVDQPVIAHYPEYDGASLDPLVRRVTVRHVLNHTSGLVRQGGDGPNWIARTILGSVTSEPGVEFSYSNAAPDLLSGIFARRSGGSARTYATSRLFEPLGIHPTQWDTDPAGNHQGANGLHMTARDLARLGYLYLNEGQWDGEQILPAAWVRESGRSQATFDRTRGYGYLMWVWDPPQTFRGAPLPSYYAYGHRGQYVGIYPELDLLVVTTADATDASRDTFFIQNYIEDFIRLFILPAVLPGGRN